MTLDPLIRQLKLMRSGISLGNVDALEAFGGKVTSSMRRQELPEGRGYYLNTRQTRLIQFAYPDDEMFLCLTSKWEKLWHGKQRATWKHAPSIEILERMEKGSSPAGITSEENTWIDDDEMGKTVQKYIELRQQEIANQLKD